MSDGQILGGIIFGLVLLVAVVSSIAVHEERKMKRTKPNIRVPRQTLWERTNKYHGEAK